MRPAAVSETGERWSFPEDLLDRFCEELLGDGNRCRDGLANEKVPPSIEGAIRYLLRDRMDLTGTSWGLPCWEAVLRLRALHSNDDFDEYWEFHLTQEKLRHFPASPDNDNACCAAVAA